METVASFPLHGTKVECLAALPGGRIATAHASTVRVWAASGELRFSLTGHTGPVVALATTPSGHTVSGSFDCTVKVWRGGACVRTFQHHSAVFAVAVSPLDGVVVSCLYCKAFVWSTSTGERVAVLKGHTSLVSSGCVLASGDVVTGSYDATVRVWERGSWACIAVHDEPCSVHVVVALQAGGFAVGTGTTGSDAGGCTGFASLWRGGRREWRVALPTVVRSLAEVQDVFAAFTRGAVFFVQGGVVMGQIAQDPSWVAVVPGNKLAVVKRGADDPVCKVVRVVRLSRMAILHIMITAWSAHRGTPPPASGSQSAAAALARTLSLRRLCRPRGEGAARASLDVVEPFARDVVGYM